MAQNEMAMQFDSRSSNGGLRAWWRGRSRCN